MQKWIKTSLLVLSLLIIPVFSADLSGIWKDGWDGSLIEMKQTDKRVEAKIIKLVRPHNFTHGRGDLVGNTLVFEFIGKQTVRRNAVLSSDGCVLKWANGFQWTLEQAAQPAQPAGVPAIDGYPEELILTDHPEGKLYNGRYVLQPRALFGAPYFVMANPHEPENSPYRNNYIFQQEHRGRKVWVLQPVQPVEGRFLANATNTAGKPWEGRWDPPQIKVQPTAIKVQVPPALEVTAFSDPRYLGVYYQQPTMMNDWPVYAKENHKEALSSPFRITYIFRQKFGRSVRWVIQPYQPDERLWRVQGYSDAELPWENRWYPRNTRIVSVQNPPDRHAGHGHGPVGRRLPDALQVSKHPESSYNGIYMRQDERINDRPVYRMENPRERSNSVYRYNYIFRQSIRGQDAWVMQAVKPDPRRAIARTISNGPLPWSEWNVRGLQVTRLDQPHAGTRPIPDTSRPQPIPTPTTPAPAKPVAGPVTKRAVLSPDRWMTRTSNRYLEGPIRVGGPSSNTTDGWNYPQRGVKIDGQNASCASGNNTLAVIYKLPTKLSKLQGLEVVVAGKGQATVGFGLRPFKEHASTDLQLQGQTRLSFSREPLNLLKRQVSRLEFFVRGPKVQVDGLEVTAIYEE